MSRIFLLISISFSILCPLAQGTALHWGDSDRKTKVMMHHGATLQEAQHAARIGRDGESGGDSDFTMSTGRSRRQGRRKQGQSHPDSAVVLTAASNRVKMWPPWPLSLLQRKTHNDKDSTQQQEQDVTASNTYPSAAVLVLVWCTQRARIGIRQLQEIGSSLWFHVPPALPPLLLVSSIPQRTLDSRTVIPLFSDPLARTLVLGGMGVALLSWAHQELHRKQQLTPLRYLPQSTSVSRVFLPPFLPELVPEPEIEALQQQTMQTNHNPSPSTTGSTLLLSSVKGTSDVPEEENSIFSLLSPRLRKHLSGLYESTPLIGTRYHRGGDDNDGGDRVSRGRRGLGRGLWKEWKRKWNVRRREAAKLRRMTIFDELVALQAIKRRARSRAKATTQQDDEETSMGYALVTGASQGIGRALAVELARWEIPLVLVARDLDRLVSLAYDIEACYGVRCCVLQADLSELDAAERIHETTTKAGLTIDILINNAGIAYEGLSTNMDTSLIERMIMINTMTFAKLSKLYGKDMVRRRRGRILMVSSMAGMTSASPNMAMYGATKAFEKSLSFSMSKELEPYGVGVTCLMPGPVTDTQFRERSGTGRALCWYIPFYARPAETVAHLGIMSLLDGDTQVLPGWQNRAFVQLFRPILPQRVETMCVQMAWTPFQWRLWGGRNKRLAPTPQEGLIDTKPPDSVHLDLKPRYGLQMPPRLLQLPVKEEVIAEPPQVLEEKTSDDDDDLLPDDINRSPQHDEKASTGEGDESTATLSNSATRALASSQTTNTDRHPANPSHESQKTDSNTSRVMDLPMHERATQTPVTTSSQVFSHVLNNATDDSDNSQHVMTKNSEMESSSSPPTRYPESAVDTRHHETSTKKKHQPQHPHRPRDGQDTMDNEDEEDEFGIGGSLSPRLGPVNLFHQERHHAYKLPTNQPNNRERENTIAPPDWTVQT